MVSSSFNCAPGVPVLHSKDLVNWSIIGHVFTEQPPKDIYKNPGHGVGVWAPSIRYHNGEFYVYYADPDYGIYQAKTTNPSGTWEHKLVQEAYGWIDPCPFWDDDNNAYLIHAYANSRIGFNSILTLRRMNNAGDTISLAPADSFMIINGNTSNPNLITIEGPKMYKRNGYYYVFSPYGGVANGSQVVLRSINIDGPYEFKTVLEQGSTDINGPHQGAWIELDSDESWFIHFQEKLPYGRIVHLQPMNWIDNWPQIGEDYDKNGIGEPVQSATKPDVGQSYSVSGPQTSDKFDTIEMGMQWQWHSNVDSSWFNLSDNPGNLRLNAASLPDDFVNLWDVGSMILQKMPAETFSVTTKVNLNLKVGEQTGLLVMGQTYGYISVESTTSGNIIKQVNCTSARNGGKEKIIETKEGVESASLYLRCAVYIRGFCYFSYSLDGINYFSLGDRFLSDEGRWIGAKIGLFCHRPSTNSGASGYADYEWFSVGPYYTQQPYAPKNPFPEDNASLSLPNKYSLTWDGDAVFSELYKVYFGTENNPTTLVSEQKTIGYTPDNTEAGKTYYWKVESSNSLGVLSSPVWSYTITDFISGISETSSEQADQIKVYPNPTSQYMVISIEIPEDSFEIDLINLEGKTVLQQLCKGNSTCSLDVRNVKKGFYILRVISASDIYYKDIIIN